MSEKETKIQERRKFVRLNASVEVYYTLVGEESEKQEQTVTKDISAGGICLIVYEPIKIGNILSLRIYLPDNEPFILTKGKVVWTKSFNIAGEKERYDVGIEFVSIGEADRKRVDKYVFSLS